MNSPEILIYRAGGKECHASFFKAGSNDAPTVLVGHTWKGKSDFEIEKASALSKLGYHAIAIDLFGEAKLGSSMEENQTLIEPFISDRVYFRKTLQETANFAQSLNTFNGKLLMIGFCFGGLATIELARSGYKFVAGASFHGLLNGSSVKTERLNSSLLILHGYKDPMVTPEVATSFQNEMDTYADDWKFISYGDSYHSFTNPLANDTSLGTIYNENAAKDAWSQMQIFFNSRIS